MIRTSLFPAPAFDATSTPADRLLAVVQELTQVMTEENTVLAEGLPAAMAETIERKQDLSDEFEHLWAHLTTNGSGALAADPEAAYDLIQLVAALRVVANENIARLDAALLASRRRIEAVMTALRGEAEQGRGYGMTGQAPLVARFAPCSTSLRA